MKDKFLLIIYGVIIVFLFFFTLFVTHYVYLFSFKDIYGSLLLFCLDEKCWLTPIKDLYFLGVLSGIMVSFAMFLSFLVLDKKGITNKVYVYLKNMDNKMWKTLFLGFLVFSVYLIVQTLRFSTMILLNIDVFFVEYNIIYILFEYLFCLCIILLSIKLVFFTKKRAFHIKNFRRHK